MFEETYNKLSEHERDDFARIVNELMLKSFLLRENYDRHSKIIKSNRDYYFVERNIDLIREYLAYTGWIVEKDSRLGVIIISNEFQDNRIRLDFTTSLIIYCLRYAYECEKEKNQTTSEVYFSAAEVNKILNDKSLVRSDKKVPQATFAAAYRFLEQHNIIARISGEYRERNLQFYILPSILYVIDNERINKIFEDIQNFEGEEF